MTQSFNLKQALRIDSEADHEIEIENDQATGIVYLAIGDDGAWIGFNFSADVSVSVEPGEVWNKSYCIAEPTAEVESVSNVTVSFDDSDGCDGFDYTARIDEIKAIITRFIKSTEIEAPNYYRHYAA